MGAVRSTKRNSLPESIQSLTVDESRARQIGTRIGNQATQSSGEATRVVSTIGAADEITGAIVEVFGATTEVTLKASHLNAVKRIFRYLKGKPKIGLWYPRVSSFDLKAYSGSDYAGANLDRKSITGGCQFLGRRLISWQCKKQTIMATSTTEAEYVAAANCCGQVLWIQNQMLDYGFNFMNTKIYIDNESTICIVKNPVFHSKTKHIAIRHHFIRDAYEKKLIQVLKIHTDDNVADLLTKAFDVSSYLGFRESLERDIDGTEELLLPDLFILWLTIVSTDSAKLIPSIHYALTVTTQAAKIKSLKAQVKKLKKQASPFILHHKAWLRIVKKKNQNKKKVLKTSKRMSVFKQGRKIVKSAKGALQNKETGTESEEITKAKKKFNQVAHDEEVARKMQEEWEAKEDRKRLTEEEATKTALSNEYDFIQARIEVDRLLAERVQEAERE
ncbi:hypothetical protein Tco_1402428 [Tanacetum coccineum]